ncbi:methyl-accepting chemotaxis protein [Biostraticola tofi]|nr:methyl-accepting chemotaxis protein [Biostraticola tofi]
MFKIQKIATSITLTRLIFFLIVLILAVLNITDSYQSVKSFDTTALMAQRNSLLHTAIVARMNARSDVSETVLMTNLTPAEREERYQEAMANLAEAEAPMKAFTLGQSISPRGQVLSQELGRAFTALYDFIHADVTTLRHSVALDKSNEQRYQVVREDFDNRVEQYQQYTAQQIIAMRDGSDKQFKTNMLITLCMLTAMTLISLYSHRSLRLNLFRRLELAGNHCRIIGKGNLVTPIEVGKADEIGIMLTELAAMQHSLTATVSNVRQSAESIHLSAQEIAMGNNDLSSRTEQQASALQQTAASMEQLKITVKHNAENAQHANQLAVNARDIARDGGHAVHRVVETMQQITASSRQIAEINRVMDGIAHQTNILALNAAVEAARAGEQGRGFAVVASEVRNLVKRSADAAKEIQTLIDDSVHKVGVGSTEAGEAGKIMQQIIQSVTQVSDLIDEISLASDEQSIGIAQISQAVNEMDTVTQQNASLVEESAAATTGLEEQAQHLNVSVSIFTVDAAAQKQRLMLANGPSAEGKSLTSTAAPRRQVAGAPFTGHNQRR